MRLIHYFFLMLLMIAGNYSCNRGAFHSDKEKVQDSHTLVVDVRTAREWNEDGHASCSVNYPLDEIMNYLDSLKGYDEVWIVCRSGNRAGQAKTILEKSGISHVENKGSWKNIDCSPYKR